MTFTGCDDLREWLGGQGFRFAMETSRENACNWYAYRASKHKARECECNKGKRAQIVVKPYIFRHPSAPNGSWESVEVELAGQAGGVWFKLQAYSMPEYEFRQRLPDVERSLIAAWNALPVEAVKEQA